jgi:hypothetical protein
MHLKGSKTTAEKKNLLLSSSTPSKPQNIKKKKY